MRRYGPIVVFVVALVSAVAKGQVPHAEDKALDMKKSAQKLDGKTMYEWMKELKDSKDPGVRVRAIHALQFYGKDAREVVAQIIKALDDHDASVRVNAAIAVGLIGLDAKDRTDGINMLMKRADPFREVEKQGIVRYQAARALGRIGPDAAPAIPSLCNAIRDKTASEIRGAAAYALGSAGWDSQKGPDPRAIRALLGALKDECHEVRMEAIFSLIVLGPPIQGTDKTAERQALEALTHDKNKVVEIWSRVAVMRLDKVSAHHLVPIAKFLKDSDLRVRVNAARAFAIMGQDAKSSVKDLVYALEDKEPDVLIWACIALGQMRDGGQEAVPRLQALAEHQDPRVKQAAAEALGKIKAKAGN